MESKVLEYMRLCSESTRGLGRQQNRPYNAQNVFDNLHGQVPKNTVQVRVGKGS